MSPGQTGHITGQMGRVPGTDGTHTRGCPAKILYIYCFFLSQSYIRMYVPGTCVCFCVCSSSSGLFPPPDPAHTVRAATLQKYRSEFFLRFSLPKVSRNSACNSGEFFRATFSRVWVSEGNQGAAKGVRQKEFDHFFVVFGTLSVTFRLLFLMLLSLFSSLFCQTPFAGLLLRQGEGKFHQNFTPKTV